MFKKVRMLTLALIAMILFTTVTAPCSAATAQQTTAQSNATTTSPITLSNGILPTGTLANGKAFTVSGKLTAKTNLTLVSFIAKDSKGNVALKVSAVPKSKTFSLYSIDSKLTFKDLPKGQYTWTLTASTASRCDRWYGSFTIKDSDVALSSYTCPSGTLVKGKTFSCKGIVKSSYKITKVTMSVYTTDGVKQFSASAAPNAKTFDLHKLDSQMTFRKLNAGQYIYRVSIITSNGIVTNVLSKSFKVK
ncbi:MAG: hypothetical protein II882_07250 [Lachnospiraceae bacterium]|nr:hypothetical protein [Lachnospiraceae bacterium]